MWFDSFSNMVRSDEKKVVYLTLSSNDAKKKEESRIYLHLEYICTKRRFTLSSLSWITKASEDIFEERNEEKKETSNDEHINRRCSIFTFYAIPFSD